jgi:hypothetical protein
MLATPGRFRAVRERDPGLDHVSFGSDEQAGLEKWASHLHELGVAHGGSSTRTTVRALLP